MLIVLSIIVFLVIYFECLVLSLAHADDVFTV